MAGFDYTDVSVIRETPTGFEQQIFSTLYDARLFAAKTPSARIQFDLLPPEKWQRREETRITTGAYKKIPETIQAIIFIYQLHATRHHYLHISSDGVNVSYTPSHEYGVLDRQIKCKIGRYFTQFYAPIFPEFFTESKIREISDIFSTALAGNVEMRIGNTREDFRFAYSGQPVKSPSSGHISCMAGKTGPREEFRSLECHPAEVYAGGDLSIAILFNPANPDVVLARSIIYPANRTHCKVYSLDHRSSLALSDKLRALKYTNEEEKYGARLLKIPATHYGADYYIMPYIDGENYANFSSDETHFILASSGYETDNTDGTMYTGHDRDSSEDDDY